MYTAYLQVVNEKDKNTFDITEMMLVNFIKTFVITDRFKGDYYKTSNTNLELHSNYLTNVKQKIMDFYALREIILTKEVTNRKLLCNIYCAILMFEM